MPNSYAESAEGVVLIANGIDPMVRWDGYADTAGAAGIVAPTTPPTFTGGGTGSITGTYVAFVRFVDRYGNVSNLSPASAEVTLTAAGQVNYAAVAVPTDAHVIRRQVLRNTDGQLRTFYVDVDTTDISSTTLIGFKTDSQLAASEAVPLLNTDGSLAANRHDPPPSTKPFLAYHLDRMWAAGEQPYAEGSCEVAQFQGSVQGRGTEWPESLAGRFLYVDGATKAYEIESVDVVNQILTLTEPYADDTDEFAAYAIRPAPAESSVVYFSEPGLPESWPPTNGLTLPEDGDVITGLMPYRSFLYVLKRRRLYRMTAQGNPLVDGFIFLAAGRGCVNHRCWAVAEQVAYLMDEAGVYRFQGGEAENLSTPVQQFFRRNAPGSIDWQASRFFHAGHDPAAETIRWFVTLRGEYLPRHALCLAYKLNRWWVEEYAVPIGSNALGRAGRPTGGWGDLGEQFYAGSVAGEILTLGTDGLDGAGLLGKTTRGRVTTATDDTITDAAAAFDTTWANVPVAIWAGRGKGQVRVVVSATATKLRVNEPWSVKPSASGPDQSQYQVGGIRYNYLGARLRYAPTEERGGRGAEVTYVPTETQMDLWFDLYQDFSPTAVEASRAQGRGLRPGVRVDAGEAKQRIDTARDHGVEWVRFDGHRERGTDAPRHAAVGLSGVAGPEPVTVGQMILNGMVL